MINENYYKMLLEAYKVAYPDLKNHTQFQQAQWKWKQVKDSVEDYDKFLVSSNARAAKLRSAQLQWLMKKSSTKSAEGLY